MTGSNYIDFDKALNTGMKLIKTKENPRLGLLIIVGINLGVRIENLLRFKFEDLRRENVTIIEGKTGKKRTLVINDNIRIAMALFENEYNGYAFKSQKDTIYSPQHVNRLLKKYFKGKISTHSLRKSFGRRVWNNDNQSERSLVYLSELFQHSSISITRIYLGIRQEELDNIYINL
ncbi:integrase [Flavobacterium nitrogenifigens]|uniref:Integrase n=2 Tax=Flavobacterium TaxID=237 RepID=A0A7W7J153_9FLAO|nr:MULTISPECIES: tyrosine-type recombinase/integrase [Flavobacterium]MBB4804190.1 integrase [Flavobacterium nitrogenifigens]MBB6389149.1 integrase [Flavobacterium notoginsengisoli]